MLWIISTYDFLRRSPSHPVIYIFLCHTKHLHVLSQHIYKPPFWPSSFPPEWWLHPEYLSPNTSNISPLHMFKPSHLSSLYVSEPSHLCRYSDTLASIFIVVRQQRPRENVKFVMNQSHPLMAQKIA